MNKIFFFFILTLSSVLRVFGDYPLIQHTNSSHDPLFSQQQQDVQTWYSGVQEPPPLMLFRYVPDTSEDLFTVAAAFNLPYETLATLNGWDSPVLFPSGKEIIVSNLPGLFLSEEPASKWEMSLSERWKAQIGVKVAVSVGEGSKKLVFYQGAKFTSAERISFLGKIFASPLHGGTLTSGFGYRPNPFTGKISYHAGVDLMADVGTPVYSVRDGKVLETGTLEIYGIYVIIYHDDLYQTMYAHLQEVLVEEGQQVQTGEIIALSGNSGISTGPHLHFEVRRNGRAIDPMRITALGEK
ncbi:MAG: hypothetical protein B0D92_00705 [Spirochaeta sp. LUC14_002_19_P3]|nr:MAG: hypothetical protein B0D92_00705 [Spirochaeta sp. LUC14_002_19_P3]